MITTFPTSQDSRTYATRHMTALLMIGLMGLFVIALPVRGTPGDVVRVSVSSDGAEGNLDSIAWSGSLSEDGRYMAFASEASNLVPGDTNGEPDVFVRDRQAGETRLVSVSTSGEQGNDNSSLSEAALPRISSDGSHVVFVSAANNLVPDDANGALDVFVYEIATGVTTRASVSSHGMEANASAWSPSISHDGRFVAFSSTADNLVPGDINAAADAFVHDRQTGETSRVSISSNGIPGNSESRLPAISASGRYVAFSSEASNLVPDDTNANADIFVHDRQSGHTNRVSISSAGAESDDYSHLSLLSANGRFVLFTSYASNLVPNDTNGGPDAFLHDRQNGDTRRVSVDSDSNQGNGGSLGTDISANGRYIVFDSDSSNLVPDDTNAVTDVFVHDTLTGETSRVSVAGDGSEGDGDSSLAAMSADGRYVGFLSDATNLVTDDSNESTDVFVYQYLDDPPPPPTTTTTSTTSTTSTTTPSTDGDYFVDDDGHIFEDSIDWIYEQGITAGCNPPDNSRFCPGESVTRAQMAAFLVRGLDFTDDGGGNHFLDTVGSIFETDIDRLFTAGVTVGCNPPDYSRFCPVDMVTRGQMAAFLTRAFGYADDGGGDLFIDDDASVFEGAIDRLATAGVTFGCNPPSNDRFCPGNAITRGQMAAFLERALREP